MSRYAKCEICDEKVANLDNLDPETDFPIGFTEDEWGVLQCLECHSEIWGTTYQERRQNERFSSRSDYSHWNEEASIVQATEDRYSNYDEPFYQDEY